MREGWPKKLFVAIVLISLSLPLQLATQALQAFRIEKEPVDVAPSTCCAPTDGFSITSVFLAPTEDDSPCFNCVPGVRARHLVTPIPRREARVGEAWSTHILIDLDIPGPCTVTVTWFSIPSHDVIFGPLSGEAFADCNNILGSIEVFNRRVPNDRGNAAVMVTFQAGDGRQVVEWEFFEIR